VTPLLQKAGLNARDLVSEVERETERLPTQSGSAGAGAPPPMARELNAALESADRFAKQLEDAYVSTEHLLLGLVDTKGTTARELLTARGVDRDTLLEALQAVRGSHRVTDVEPESK